MDLRTEHICKVLMIMRLPLLKRLADFQMSAVAKALVTSSNWKVGSFAKLESFFFFRGSHMVKNMNSDIFSTLDLEESAVDTF